MFALKIWRHYLYGLHVDVFTHHKSLQYVFTQKELNLRQIMCVKHLKDYDINVLNHPGKANIVVDALSRMTMNSMAHVEEGNKDLLKDVHRLVRLGVCLEDSPKVGFMVHDNSESSLVFQVKSKQHFNP